MPLTRGLLALTTAVRVRFLPTAAASAAIVLVAGASAVSAAPPTTIPAPIDYAYVRILDAMTGQPALDVYVMHVATLTPPNYPHVRYGRWTAYQRMYFTPDCVGKSVCKLEFEMAMPGQTSGFKRDELAFRAGRYYTVALAATGSTGPNFIVIHEATSTPSSTSLRFGNLTSDVTKTLDFSAVRMTWSASPATANASNVAYAQLTTIRPVAAGPWNVQFGVHGSMFMARGVTNANLVAGTRYAVYAIGSLGGTGAYAARFILVPNT